MLIGCISVVNALTSRQGCGCPWWRPWVNSASAKSRPRLSCPCRPVLGDSSCRFGNPNLPRCHCRHNRFHPDNMAHNRCHFFKFSLSLIPHIPVPQPVLLLSLYCFLRPLLSPWSPPPPGPWRRDRLLRLHRTSCILRTSAVRLMSML
jgi:hypothetical protein